MKWFAQAPANIALIKYMGKIDPINNTPSNSSLSYTLNDLLSFVELEYLDEHQDRWEPLDLPGGERFKLTETAQQRFLNHLKFLKQQMGYEGCFTVRSCNNFPASTGMASSASSFAALTICANRAIAELTNSAELATNKLAKLSQHGSGSSCRSFFAPWALWTSYGVNSIDLPYTDLIHKVVLVSHDAKTVSSSEAHKRVTTSPHFAERPNNAEIHLSAIKKALNDQNWKQAYKICWDEFVQLHQLFATSEPPFHYMTDETKEILRKLKSMWEQENDGPLVTLDAGPNVHLLYRADQAELEHAIHVAHFLGNHDVI